MKIYRDDRVALHHGDALEVLATWDGECVDSVVTDPPYGIGFMGKDWDKPKPNHGARGMLGHISANWNDKGTHSRGYADNDNAAFQAWCEQWAVECYRVLKPGGHLLAFGGTRTYHRLACAVEDAGFEIRDSVMWLYGQGFPKSLNVGKKVEGWEGWGTALKPGYEPIVVARKPFKGPVAANVLAHGTGALNIDGCRIGIEGGRWPVNVVLDDEAAAELDAQSGTSASRVGKPRGAASGDGWGMTATGAEYADTGGASRFFYCAKASSKERPKVDGVAHATVKPLALMRWLVRLVTPPDGRVLDPFAGSGTTLEAALLEGVKSVGIELDETHLPLIMQRIERNPQEEAS